MRRINAGTTGEIASQQQLTSEIELPSQWATVVDACVDGNPLRPVQAKALVEFCILDTRRHLVVCAPTNSGKSLIGNLILLEAIQAGHRAVLLEPLRALAQEKAGELSDLLTRLHGTENPDLPAVHLSTGDYRLEHETFQDPPPTSGELIVATPERLEAIIRNPDHEEWFDSLGAVVFDEAHLLGDKRRGPTIELLIATLLGRRSPPRLVLLSATIGAPERLQDWLAPCDLIVETQRTPPLTQEVMLLEEDDSVDEVLRSEIADALRDPANAALVFVYRRSSAASLATTLQEHLGEPVLAYHSGLSATARSEVRRRYHSGETRCVVTTTALAMGVNLPATHVFVRDTTFHGFGKLRVDELMQILGRAGRGQRDGTGIVLIRPSDGWDANELAESLKDQNLQPIESSFEKTIRLQWEPQEDSDDERAAELLSVCLSRADSSGMTTDDLRKIMNNTLAGPVLGECVDRGLGWLESPERLLGHLDTSGRHHLTTLGRRGARAALPLPYVAGFAGLIRDLIQIDDGDQFLSRWSVADHLFVKCLLFDRSPTLRRYSRGLTEQVDGWHESVPLAEKSFLFREWVSGTEETSKADELFGSLGLPSHRSDQQSQNKCMRVAYVAMLNAIIMIELSRGTPLSDLERRWSIKNLEGVAESWRDAAMWILAGQAQICELRCFYYHLRENCQADDQRIKRTKRHFSRMRHQLYDLLEQLKFCSPLGPIVRGVRGMLKHDRRQVLGKGTIRLLEDSGVTSLAQLANLEIEELLAMGVQRRFAKQIKAYIRRRLR